MYMPSFPPPSKDLRMGIFEFARRAVWYNLRRLCGMGREFPEVKGMNYRQYLTAYLPQLLPERMAR